jgi:nitrite reductase/ring-hydroxylating ferredoxin subunit
MKVVIAPLSSFPAGSRRIVKAGSREIGVFRVGDAFYAVRNRCPHQGAPLCLGPIRQKLVADEPGALTVDDGPPLITCPWHQWHWDAATGEAYAPGDPRVRSFPVAVESGAAITEEAAGAEPMFAEIFSVVVEDDYVVLDA